MTLRNILLLVVLSLSAASHAVSATFTPRGHGDEGPALQRVFDNLVAMGGGDLYLENPPPGTVCEIDTPIRVSINMQTINTIGRGLRWEAYQYRGKGAALTFIGLKNSRLVDVTLLLFTPGSIGMDFAGDADHQSQSEISLEHCRVQAAEGATNCTGVRIGNTGNDHSDYVIDRCTFYGSVPCFPSDVPGSCARVHAFGFRGVEILGWNTLNCSVLRTSVTAADVAFSNQGRAGESPQTGGSGTLYEGNGGSFNVLVWLFDGNYPERMTGGRWENGAGVLLQGARLSGGQGTGHLTIEDVMIDGYDSLSNRSFGYIDDGALFGIYSNGWVRMDNVNGYADRLDPAKWVAVRSNAGSGAILAISRCVASASSLRALEGQIVATSASG